VGAGRRYWVPEEMGREELERSVKFLKGSIVVMISEKTITGSYI